MLNAYYSSALSASRSEKDLMPGIVYLAEGDFVCIKPVGSQSFDSVVLDGNDIVAIVDLARKFLSYDQALEIMDLIRNGFGNQL